MTDGEINVIELVEPSSALAWFGANAGQTVPWSQLNLGARRGSAGKAIYKPAGSQYALSVKMMKRSPYPNVGPLYRRDGTWVVGYHQEGFKLADRDQIFTNLALLRNVEDRRPIGLLKQVAAGVPEYSVLGLGLPVGWVNGLFILEGPDAAGVCRPRPDAYADLVTFAGLEEAENSGEEQNTSWFDGRKRAIAQVIRRQGQSAFRQNLLDAYGGRCALSECSTSAVLDACHLDPYMGPHTNLENNGLLLRTDLHSLFDLGLLAFDPVSRKALLAPELHGTEYSIFAGRRLAEPKRPDLRPRDDRLRRRLLASRVVRTS